MKYYLEITDVKIDVKYFHKESDDIKELQSLIKELKDDNGKYYSVSIGEHTGFVGEDNRVESKMAIGKNNAYPEVIRLNKKIVESL